MEPAIVVGVIAAVVSVFSVVANVNIARKTRQSAVDALRFKARLDREEEIDKVIKEIEIEGERLRIRSWELIHYCDSREILKGSKSRFPALTEEFSVQARHFIDSWASVKSELPSTELNILRRLRHECWHYLQNISVMSQTLISDKQIDQAHIKNYVGSLNTLLELIDNFTRIVCKVRRRMLEGDFSTDDLVWMSENDPENHS
ncbi:MAG: hypothetical protein ABR990_10890 [Terracidiphilus sp.]